MQSLQGYIATELKKQDKCPEKYKDLVEYTLIPEWYNRIYQGSNLWKGSSLVNGLRYFDRSGNPLDWTKTIEFKCRIQTSSKSASGRDKYAVPFRFVYQNGYYTGAMYDQCYGSSSYGPKFMYFDYNDRNRIDYSGSTCTYFTNDRGANKARDYWVKNVWVPSERRFRPYLSTNQQGSWGALDRVSQQIPTNFDMKRVIIEVYNTCAQSDANMITSSVQIIQNGVVVLDGSRLRTT